MSKKNCPLIHTLGRGIVIVSVVEYGQSIKLITSLSANSSFTVCNFFISLRLILYCEGVQFVRNGLVKRRGVDSNF